MPERFKVVCTMQGAIQVLSFIISHKKRATIFLAVSVQYWLAEQLRVKTKSETHNLKTKTNTKTVACKDKTETKTPKSVLRPC